MKSLVILTLLFFTKMASANHACTEEDFTKKISKGLPLGTDTLIKRIVECNHWGEETGYDDTERAEQIRAGVEKARCDLLDQDRINFSKRYPNNKKLQEAFKTADAWDGKCD